MQAIASPCSTCKNTRNTPDGLKPACPRQVWITQQQVNASVGINSTTAQQFALDSGTAGPGLSNPVVSDNGYILVWIATTEKNSGLFDSGGNLVNPPLLDPNFDTNYIVCESNPYTIEDSENTYRMNGAIVENDQLAATSVSFPQVSPTPNTSYNLYDRTQLGGFVKKVQFPYFLPRTQVTQDSTPRGT